MANSMCTVSFVADYYKDKWTNESWVPVLSEVYDMVELVKKAKQYDIEHGEPDCQVAGKINYLKSVANNFGVNMDDYVTFSKFMDVDVNVLNEALHSYTVKVEFEKANGENRVMLCTLNSSILPIDEEYTPTEKSTETPTSLAVWDVEKNGWRSFRLDKVITWEVV